MTLTTPLALLGLLTLPIILALHMFRARSRRAVVSSLQLWQFMETEVRGSRARRIPLTWILIMDLLIAALLTFALANPTLAQDQQATEAHHLVLVLDTSTSMLAQDRFEQARSELRQVLGRLNPSDIATLIVGGPTAAVIGGQSHRGPDLNIRTPG